MSERRFDSVFNANVSKKGDGEYEIRFLDVGDITVYQVWNETDPTINGKRVIITTNVENWVNEFNFDDRTTLMEIGNCKYAFVIKDIELKDRKMRWVVSEREIVNRSKTVSERIPVGKFCDVRFDVDSAHSAQPVGSPRGSTLRNIVRNV